MNQLLEHPASWVKKERPDVKKLRREERAFHSRLLGCGVEGKEEWVAKGESV